ncbi:MAG TPA: quinolinate synthase NadA [Candidatus Omnitrophota bacterium]|nr:quinolinate synthase NadA [Candidatus Omnitrophota bacterium]
MTHVRFKDDLGPRIKELKKKRNAVILAHNYQLPEVQDVADYRGDSLELSRIAAKTEAGVIVFCGVHFMAETASILSPHKKVIMPDAGAGCPMATMLTAEQLRDLKQKHPQAVVVGYVNTSAEVKAELDVCCTSTNAVAVVNALQNAPEIIFVPDKYLADYVSRQTGRALITWNGFCSTHIKILPEDILREKKFHPRAKVLVHPECLPEVVAMADAALSTSQMGKYVKQTDVREMIIGTETGIIYRLKQDNPDKEFYPASERAVCPNMKRTTQEKIVQALETMQQEVRVSDEIRRRAIRAIEKMVQIV